ncbi:sigma-70 family RNA polymerase sigma factor [Shouchella tritolerans]|uniref:sigma-70 family RNA polymerase sigma factor n=1 Tax=Shouchella tritolerans TaxID=2979466 RepID=UPI0021E7D433|nr:sigma-70 family RNA polymerase sigma factor [Shouchella tritolerans]
METAVLSREQKSRNEMIMDNIGLVHHVCKQFKSRGELAGIPYEDLIQVGTIGLIKAVDRFEPERELAFSTYAVPKISFEIRKEFRDYNPDLKLTRSVKLAVMKIRYLDNWEQLSIEEIADQLEIEKAIAQEAVSYLGGSIVSLDSVVHGDDGKDVKVADLTSDNTKDETEQDVKEFLSLLDERMRVITQMTLEGHPQTTIAEEIGVSQVQVSRIIKNRIAPLLKLYLEGEPMAKGNLKLAKKMLVETNKSASEIAKETGCNVGTLYTYKSQLNKKQGGSKVEAKPKLLREKEVTPNYSDSNPEMDALKTLIHKLEEDNKKLRVEIKQLKEQQEASKDQLLIKAERDLYYWAWQKEVTKETAV